MGSQDRLVNTEGGGVDLGETEISWDFVSNRNLKDVSRNNVNSLDLLNAILVRADDLSSLWLVFLECLNSRFCISLLPYTNNSVGNENEKDDERFNKSCDGIIIFKEGEDKGDDGSEQQNFDEEIIELLENKFPDCLALFSRELISSLILPIAVLLPVPMTTPLALP